MKTQLEKLLAEETFEPYVFVMNSGDRYEVRNFNMAVRQRDAITVTGIALIEKTFFASQRSVLWRYLTQTSRRYEPALRRE